MTLQVLLAVGLADVAVLVLVIVFINGLSDEVQAVQLVENLERRSVALLACVWMLDL